MRGTLFRLFPQATDSYPEPELIEVSRPAGTVGPGPSDDRLIVVDAVDKVPYDPPLTLPPFRGAVRPPAWPDQNGDFAWIPIDTEQFLQAHLYGCVRLSVDVWEKYLGRTVRWMDLIGRERLELVPLVEWANAQSGPGFMEMGCQVNNEGEMRLFCLNADVIAHETGHTVLFAELGTPAQDRLTGEFLAFHESLSDMTALLTALHFETVLDRVLTQTNGNMYVANDSNKIGELSSTQQIRVADNTTRMSDLAGLRLAASGDWIDPSGQGRNAHALAQPLTGALFDFLVDLYQDNLVTRGVIAPDDDARGWDRDEVDAAMATLAATFGNRYETLRGDFREALVDARDTVGFVLGAMVDRVDIDDLSFGEVAGVLLEVTSELVGLYAADMLAENLRWREIDPVVPARVTAGVMLATARRFRAGVPYAQQIGQFRALRHAACCLPARRHEGAVAFGLGKIIRAEHRRPD
ncbi:hypothetical protein GCM10007036_29290 [Alsobacter metallidurans]|uniref:Uncharacterized protein n=1 Tax=Alsobacter metallidurans TaxID=340221 RepID=A0A917MIY7_9HYPH|nr:hypothetical protein [Alsobacter metallidurans]GGH23494.1 hypothetical protein GCM10007036_29290 [Alsobacter metallidurans]